MRNRHIDPGAARVWRGLRAILLGAATLLGASQIMACVPHAYGYYGYRQSPYGYHYGYYGGPRTYGPAYGGPAYVHPYYRGGGGVVVAPGPGVVVAPPRGRVIVAP